MKDFKRLLRTLHDIFQGVPPAKASDIRRIFAIGRVLQGEPIKAVCADLKLQLRNTDRLAKEVEKRGLAGIVPQGDLTEESVLANRRLGIAQMLLGALAERRFEELSDEITGPGVLKVEDHRPSRTDTDYRLRARNLQDQQCTQEAGAGEAPLRLPRLERARAQRA